MSRGVRGFVSDHSRFLLTLGCAAAALVSGLAFYVLLAGAAERSVSRNAERVALAWAQFFSSHFVNLEARLAPGADFGDIETIFGRSRGIGDIFRFKLFDKDGATVFVSDEPAPAPENLIAHNRAAAAVFVTGRPHTFVLDGSAKPNRPDVYAEAYVPVFQGARIVGVVEVYVDQTAAAATIYDSYLEFGGAVGALILLAFAMPAFGMAVARRSLVQRNHELIAARDLALQAEQAKAEFLANMSHEIRTPMNGVLGMVELLAGTHLAKKQKMFVDVIHSSARSLLNVINDILDFSKIDAGQLKLDARPFKLSTAANEPAQLLAKTAFDKNLELLVRIDPRLPVSALGDFSRIRQIATNFLANAVKFTDSGEVAIELAMAEDAPAADGRFTLKIMVRDTGVGIPADKLDSVFDKFTQVDATAAREHEGTGLGLAICKGLVDLMGGEVGAESVPGRGSLFWARLPLVVAEAGDAPVPSVEAIGKRVLVVDDNQTNRIILCELLSSWRMEEHAASSGHEGLQKLTAAARRGAPYDLVLLDHHMPGMDGEQVLRHMRETPELAEIPVIVLSSMDNFGDVRQDDAVAPDAALVKPVAPSTLLDQIMTVLSDGDGRNAAPAPPKEDAPAAAPPRAASVLIVEDNRVNQIVAAEMLKTFGLIAAIADNGREGVQARRDLQPRIVFMDVSMPLMSGFDATAAIRRLEADEGLPRCHIVGLTAHAMPNDREKCLAAGMDDYIPKPIEPERVKDALVAAGVLRESSVGAGEPDAA